MIRNNKAQSMITVMLLIMILGVIVTLIVSSTITDTRKLLVQKSYERAYSLSEQYLTKIVLGDVLGASEGTINGVLVGNTNGNTCSVNTTSNVTNYTTPIIVSCRGTGSDQSSIVNCTRTTEIFGKSLKIQTDEPINIDYSKISLSYADMNSSTPPRIYLRYKNADAAQITYKYEETIAGSNYPKSVSFIISTNPNYSGALPISTAITTPTYPQSLVDIVNKPGSRVINLPSTSPSISQSITDTLNSIQGTGLIDLYIDVKNLAANVKTTDSHFAKSIQIKFLRSIGLNESPGIVDFAMYNQGFNETNQKELAFQFHKFKCDAFDSAYDTTNLGDEVLNSSSKGFGSARLEAFVPINKALPDFFDYSLFVGGGIGGNSTTGYPVIINK